MARKARDYKAEYARRNALAKERGFKGYADQRKQMETGQVKFLQQNRLSNRRSIAANKSWIAREAKRAQQTINDFFRDAEKPAEVTYESAIRNLELTAMAIDWSNLHAATDIAEYHPERAADLGVTVDEYTQAYLEAFAGFGGETYYEVRRRGGSDALRYWFVELNDYYEAAEYDDRYTGHSGK